MSNQRFRSNEANNAHTSDGFEDELILWEINEVLRCNSPPPDNKNQSNNISRNQNSGGQNIIINNTITQDRHQQNGQNDDFSSHHSNQNQQNTHQHKTNLNQHIQQQNVQYKNQMLQQVLQGKNYRSTQPGNEELKKMMKVSASQNIQIQQQQITRSPQSSQQNLLRDCQVQQQHHSNVDQSHIISNQPQQHIIVQQISSPLQQGTIALQLTNTSNQQIVGTNFPTESLRPVSQMSTSKNMLPTTSRTISSNDPSYISPVNNNNQVTTTVGGNNRQSGQLSSMLNSQQILQQRQNSSHSISKNQQSNNNVFEKRSIPYQQVQPSLSRPQSQSQIVNSPVSVSTPQSNQKYVESPTYSNPPSNSQNNPSPKMQQRQNVNGHFLVQSQLQQIAPQGSNTVVVLPSNRQNIARYNEDTRVVTQPQYISSQARTVGAIIQPNNVQQTRFVPQFSNANILTTTSSGDLRQEIFQTGNINAKSQPIIIEQGGSRIVQHVVLGTPQINQNIRTSSVPTTVSIQSQPITHTNNIQQSSVQTVTIHGQKHVNQQQIQQNSLQQQQQIQSQVGQNYVNSNTQSQQHIQHIQINKQQPQQQSSNINIQQSGGNKKNTTKPINNRAMPKKKGLLTPTTTTTTTSNTSFNNLLNNSSSKLQNTPTTSSQQVSTVNNDNMLQANQMAVRLSIENLHQISRISEEIEKLKQLQIKTGQNQSDKIKSLEDKRGLIFISALQQQHNVTTQIQTSTTKLTSITQTKQTINGSKSKGQNKRNQKTTITTPIINDNSATKMAPSSNIMNTNKQSNSSTKISNNKEKNINRNMDKKSLQQGNTDINESRRNHSSSSQSFETSKSDDNSKLTFSNDTSKKENSELLNESNHAKSIDDNIDENSKESCTSPEEPKIVIPTSSIQASRILSHLDYRKRNIELFKMEMLKKVNNPDVSTPFQSKKDVVTRLIPYSIFEEPELKTETLERFDHDYLRLRNSQLSRIKLLEKRLRGKMMKEAETPTQFKADHIQFLMMDVEYEKRRLKKEKEKANTDEIENFIDREFVENGNNINLVNDLKNFIQKKQESIPVPHKLHFNYDLPEVDPNNFIPNIPDSWKTPYYTVYDSSEDEVDDIDNNDYETTSEHSEIETKSQSSCNEKESIENIKQESSLIFIKSSAPYVNPLTSSNIQKFTNQIQMEQTMAKSNNNILTEKDTNNEQTSITAMLQKLEGLDNTKNNITNNTSLGENSDEKHYQKLSIRLPKPGLLSDDIISTNTKFNNTNLSFSTESLLNINETTINISEKSSHSLKNLSLPISEVSANKSSNNIFENIDMDSSLILNNEKITPKCILKIPKINKESDIKLEESINDKDRRRQEKRDRKEKKKAKKLEKQRLRELNATGESIIKSQEILNSTEILNNSKNHSPTPRLVLKLNRNTSFKDTLTSDEKDSNMAIDDNVPKKIILPLKIDKKHENDNKKNPINVFKKPKDMENDVKVKQNQSFNENLLKDTVEERNTNEFKKRKSDGPPIIPLKIPKLKLAKSGISEIKEEVSNPKITEQLSIPKLKIPKLNISNNDMNMKIQKLSISKKCLSTLPDNNSKGSNINTSSSNLSDINSDIYTSFESLPNTTSEIFKKEKKSKEERKNKESRKDKEHKKKKHKEDRIVAPLKLSFKQPFESCQNVSTSTIKNTEMSKTTLNLNRTWNSEESTSNLSENVINSEKESVVSKLSMSTDSIKIKNSDLVLKLSKIKKDIPNEHESNIKNIGIEKIKPLKLSLKGLKEKHTDNPDIPPLKIKKKCDKNNIDKVTKEHKKIKDKKKRNNSYPVRPLHGTNPVLPPQERLASAYAEVERRSMIGKAPTLMNFL
uniref:GLTSCR1 domain-containing protein n=1 Tax=Strongyloides stercoralis TaxID=6248 RepID=A0A0K0DZG9_STRER